MKILFKQFLFSLLCLVQLSLNAQDGKLNAEQEYDTAEKAFKEGDYTKAKYHYEKAAGLGNVRAFYAIGRLYETGNGVTRNDQKAFSIFLEAAEAGYPYAMYKLADAYGKGHYFKKDLKKAIEWSIKLAAALQDGRRLTELQAEYFYKGFGKIGNESLEAQLIGILKKMYANGIKQWDSVDGSEKVHVLPILAKAYREGYGVAKDEKTANAYEQVYEMELQK